MASSNYLNQPPGARPPVGRDDLTTPALSTCSTSRSASPASHNSSNIVMAAVINKKNRQKNDKAVEVLNKNNGAVIARFRTQTECAKYLQATPEAVSYHCSKKGGGVCNGLVIRPCNNSVGNKYGLFDGAEEGRPKRRPQLKPETVAILKQWILSPEHIDNPYPTPKETEILLRKTGLDKTQLKHWFNNARKRILKPILGKKKAAGSPADPASPSPVVQAQEKRKAVQEHVHTMKRSSKKPKDESHADNSNSSGMVNTSVAPVSQFGILFGSERAGAGALNSMPQDETMKMGMSNTRNPVSTGFNQGGPSAAAAMMGMSDNAFDNSRDFSRIQAIQGNNIFPQQQQQQQQTQPSPVVFKQQVASMAMKEATIAFKNMEDAYAMAKEIMALLSASGSVTNIEEDPRFLEATAHAKKLHSVALFKLKVSKKASEEAEKAFELMQGIHRLP
mmetsp:Transcript_26173/g.37361  ORF Transcript_26173/g.37361 Transcript_26173/m.37361 type:complete len:448 (-) Transcript_26173:108-1451(-)